MKANHPCEWQTPQERAEMDRIDNLTLDQVKAELEAQGVDHKAFSARIKTLIESLKKKTK